MLHNVHPEQRNVRKYLSSILINMQLIKMETDLYLNVRERCVVVSCCH